MNFAAIRTSMQNNGRFDASQDTVMKDWVAAAYSYVWNSADFQFKKVVEASLAVVGGNDKPTVPTDFGTKLELWDQYGSPLAHLDEREYEDIYRAGKIAGQTGMPEAFKVVNRIIYLAPTPSGSATFKCSYTRRVSTFQSDGTTIRPGGFASATAADTDIPLWDVEHHMVLVYKGLEIGAGLETDTSGIFWSELANDALGAMITDLAAVKKAPAQWGRRYR